MVIPCQVEEPVDQQPLDLPMERMPFLPGLTDCHGHRNDDVPQHADRSGQRRPLAQGKGEHVRRTVDAAVAPVQGAHGSIADEQHAHLRVTQAEGP